MKLKFVMDKLREDFNKEFALIDLLDTLTEEERSKYFSNSNIYEGTNDPTVVNISREEFEEWIVKYNLHDTSEWIERFKNL